ncbi:MAG: hypothetical protein ACLRYY_06490 [Anaerobutyricum soehngenii]
MKWNKLTIETTTAAEDMLSYELSEMGMEGVEIEDHVPLSEEGQKDYVCRSLQMRLHRTMMRHAFLLM